MSEKGPSGAHEYIRQMKSEIFGRFTDILMDGVYYPPQNGRPYEVIEPVPQLGDMAVCSAEVEIVDYPNEIHVSWVRREQGRYVDLWLLPHQIEAQYSEWDEDGNPFTITARAPIHPEALLELHQAIMNAPA